MKRISLSLVSILFAMLAFAQSPERFNYQGVARDNGGNVLANQPIGLQIDIRQTTSTGTVVYSETHATTTNAFGLFYLQIGGGTPQLGTLGAMDWASGPYFTEVSLDPAGGISYVSMGVSQMLSVPYALHANTADSIVGGISVTETDPVFGASIANGITALDTANWNIQTVDTDTQLDSTGVATLGFAAGPHTIDTNTQLDSTGVATLGFVAGPHTIDTDTQLDSTGVATLGFVAGPHTIDTNTQLDSTGVATLGFVAGPHADSTAISNMGFTSGSITPTIEYKKLYMAAANNYMANLSWIQIYTNGVNGEIVVKVPSSASSSARVSYALNNGTPIASTVSVGNSVTITGLISVRLEIICVEYSNIGSGGVLNWTGLGMLNGWQMGHVMYE